ncbi:MAG: hypothetical protein RI958_2067 [Actinomycetota bacterium]
MVGSWRDQSMRIVFLSSAYLPHVGGIEVLLQQVSAELRGRGHEVVIVTADAPAGSTSDLDECIDGVMVHRFDLTSVRGARSARELVRHQRRLSSIYRCVRPDVVHSHEVGMLLWLHQASTRSRPVPTVVSLHTVLGAHMGGDPSVLSALGRLLVRADAVMAVSAAVADDVARFAPSVGSVEVVPNGVQPPPGEPVERDPRLLVAVGRLESPKLFGLAIDAMVHVRESFADARLVIAGSGPDEAALRCQIRRLGLGDTVELLGRVEQTGVRSLMAQASMLVMPTRYEGLPLVAIEAAWAGTPVVGSAVAGLAEVVEHGRTGVLVDGFEPRDFARAITELMGSPDRARALGCAARERAEQRFGLAQCVTRFEDMYQQVIDRHGNRAVDRGGTSE